MSSSCSLAVIMCTYNGEKYIKEQLDSILAQTYKNFSLNIFDDCSTDGTLEILKTYQNKFTQISIEVRKTNLGFVKNFESAIKETEADFIALADQDDIWHENKLTIQMQSLLKEDNSKPLLVHCDLCIMDKHSNLLKDSYFAWRKHRFDNCGGLNRRITHNGVIGQTIIFNRALKEQILPFPKGLHNHDYWIANVNEVIGKRITLYESLNFYRVHEKNQTNKKLSWTSINKLLSLPRLFNPYFMYESREKVIKELDARFDLTLPEKKILLAFLCYLNPRFNVYKTYSLLIKNNLLIDSKKDRAIIFILLCLDRVKRFFCLDRVFKFIRSAKITNN